MRSSAPLLVAVTSMVYLASSARIKAPVKRSLSSAREEKYLAQYGTPEKNAQKVPKGQSFDGLEQFGMVAFPDEASTATTEELHEDRDEAVPEAVKLAITPTIEELQKDRQAAPLERVKLAITPTAEELHDDHDEALPEAVKLAIAPPSEDLRKNREESLVKMAVAPTTEELRSSSPRKNREEALVKLAIAPTTAELGKNRKEVLVKLAIEPTTAILREDFEEAPPEQAMTHTTVEIQRDREKPLPDIVEVAGLDFNTDIRFMTEVLHGFGQNPFQKALARIPWNWQEFLALHCFGSEHYWHGGWVLGCPDEATTDLRRDLLFISSLGTRDQRSTAMVPRQWSLQWGRGYLSLKDIKALRRSTKSWLFGEEPNLCLWTGEEIVILNDAPREKCWSHRLRIEESQIIADLCK